MAFAVNDVVWRARASGNNVNGGGYSPSQTGVLSTTLNGSVASGATTITVASATGWPSSGNYYARIGSVGAETFTSGAVGSSEIVLVTGGQGTTTWTVTRNQLGTGTTTATFASGTVVDNNLSQCTTAAFSASDGTSTASTTFISATAAFNQTVVGNVLWIASGTGATVGPYVITGYTNSTTITLDRASGTMTAAVFKIGGAWADPWTNANYNGGTCWPIPGNTIYVRAGGSGTWSGGAGTADFTISTYVRVTNGDTTNGRIKTIGENGRPYLKTTNASFFYYNASYLWLENLYLIGNGTNNSTNGIIQDMLQTIVKNCVVDQNGADIMGIQLDQGSTAVGCEVYSSTANSSTAGSAAGLSFLNVGATGIGNNVHDCWGIGISTAGGNPVVNNVVAKNRGDGISMTDSTYPAVLANNTIDANHGNGIVMASANNISISTVVGNIITNHTTGSTYGIKTSTGTLAANDRIRGFIDYNSYYGNTTNALNLTVGTVITATGRPLHDNIAVDPQYSAQSTENYAIGTNLKALGYPGSTVPFVQSLSAQTTGVTSYIDPGAVQRQEAGGSTVIAPNIVRNIYLTEDQDYV